MAKRGEMRQDNRDKMQVTFPFNLRHLCAVFPSDLPKNLVLTDSYGDAVVETEPFRGLGWPDVGPHLLKRCFEVVYFFSPPAMHYYLPAFIWCSGQDFEKVRLPVNNLLNCLRPTRNAASMAWRRARWERLSLRQWKAVRLWLEWLRSLSCAADLDSLEIAYAAVIDGAWHRPGQSTANKGNSRE
jgi:hypothetical protein